jgi:DNA-binding MarR family transcriptional regulator
MSVERTGRRGAAHDLIAPDEPGPESAAALLMQLMPTIQRVAVAAMRQAPHTAGMTLPQFRILARLSEREHRAGELAEALEIGAATLTVTADTLERRGLIERARGLPDDRRAVVLRLTPAGRTLFRALKARAVSGISRLLEQSEPGECEALIAGLEALQRGLRGLCAEASATLTCTTPDQGAHVEERAHGCVEEDA